jgi:hypothetical protein
MKKLVFLFVVLISMFVTSCTKEDLIVSLTCKVEKTDVTTYNGNDGSITVTVLTGNDSYVFKLDGETKPNGTFNSLKAGNYNVSVSDSKNETFSADVTLTQPNAPTLVATVEVDSVTVYGGNDGKITVIISSGVKPYTYSKNSTDFQTSNIFDGLTADTYNITIKDSINTPLVLNNIKVGQPNEPIVNVTATTSSTNVTCNGKSDGSITVTILTGTPPYIYTLTPNNTTNTTGLFTSLTSGNYTISIKDSKNQSCYKDVTITEPPVISATTTITNVLCNGNNDGSIVLTTNGGTSPYTYLWNTGATTSSISNLTAGTYNVTITDDNGCTITSSENITQPIVLSSTTTTNNVTTYGGNDGSITVTPNGGTSPYTYLWNTGATTSSISNLIAGTYDVTITDNNGCTLSVTNISITQPSAPLVHIGDLKNGGIVFSVNSDGVSGLITYTSINTLMTLSEANDYCNNLIDGSWRLPTKDELNTLLTVAITNTKFSYITDNEYWSFTQYTRFLNHYYAVSFDTAQGPHYWWWYDAADITNKFSSIAVKSF